MSAQRSLFEPHPFELQADANALSFAAEIKAMAEHGRRSHGQKTRLDYFQRALRVSALRVQGGEAKARAATQEQAT